MKLSTAALLACLTLSLTALAADATATPPTTAAPAVSAAASGTNVAETDPTTWVYMVTRIKLTGTDLTQVVFFQHSAITTMDACETERQAGLSTGWNYFSRYYLKTLKGIAYSVDYRCVEGKLKLPVWRQGMPHDNFYLVSTVDNKLEIKPQRNFFDCRDTLRETSKAETIDNFCAISSQALPPPGAPKQP